MKPRRERASPRPCLVRMTANPCSRCRVRAPRRSPRTRPPYYEKVVAAILRATEGK